MLNFYFSQYLSHLNNYIIFLIFFNMYIRRNMSSNVMYQDIKDFFCFKSLAKDNDVLLLKQILPLVVKRVPLQLIKENINHAKNIYIPQQNGDGLFTGYPISQSCKEIKQTSKIKLLVIQRSIYNILQNIFFRSIPFLDELKSFQKLNFLYRSKLEKYLFNGYIYRKDQPIINIYYLIKGEVKLSKVSNDKQEVLCTLQPNQFFGIYQFSQNSLTRILNAKSTSNDTLVLQISLDMAPQAFGNDEIQVIQNFLKLPSQLTKINENRQSIPVSVKRNSKGFVKAYQFFKRVNQFQKQRQLQILSFTARQPKHNKHQISVGSNSIKKLAPFSKYIENKSLLFKVNDANKSSRCEKNDSERTLNKFHKNNSMMKYYSRLNDHRLSNSGWFIKKGGQTKCGMGLNQNQKYKNTQASKLMRQYLHRKQEFKQNNFV